MTTPGSTPAGWYPDPQGGAARRWWDGTQWTDQLETAAAGAAAAVALRAPEGTVAKSPWIWWLVIVPLVPVIPIFFADLTSGILESAANPTSLAAQFAIYTDPFVIASFVLSFIATILSIVFAYADHKHLVGQGIPKPFHWAFIFFTFASVSYWVYVIGRAVVLKSRTGRADMGPVWVAIVLNVVVVIAVMVWSFVAAFAAVSSLPFS